jgi:hypothetical protein
VAGGGKRHAHGIFPGQRPQAGQGFAETVGIPQRTFKKSQLTALRQTCLDAQSHPRDRCIKLQRFEMRLEDAQKHFLFTAGRRNGEGMRVGGSVFKLQLHAHARGNPVEQT